MTAVSDVVSKVSEQTGMSAEDVLLKIKEKQEELSGLVSEEGAAYIVANELGVQTTNKILDTTLKVKDIMPEMKAVTVTGKVERLFGVREFESKGRKGKVANFVLKDDTGSMRIVLWNVSDIEKIEKGDVKVGSAIQVKNGYVRKGLNDNLEVNLGNRGRLIENPENVPDVEVAEARNVSKLSDIKQGDSVSVVCRVKRIFGVKEFDKGDRKGKVGTLIIDDGNDSKRFVLWNEKTDLLEGLNEGDALKIENAYAKQGLNDVEVQANWKTVVDVNPKGVEAPEISVQKQEASERIKISDLKEGDTYKEIRGIVVNFFGDNWVFDMCPNCNKRVQDRKCEKCGEVEPDKLLVLNAMVDDGTGTIRAAFFRNAAEKLIGMATKEISSDPEKAKVKLDEILGKERILEGRVKRNERMDRLEFTVFSLKDVDPAKEANEMLNKMEDEKK